MIIGCHYSGDYLLLECEFIARVAEVGAWFVCED